MNKAFVKEDNDNEDDDEPISTSPVFQGKNYITPAGLKRLQDEYKELKYKERPEVCKVVQWAAENGDRSENADYTYGKKRLREIDRKLRFLSKRIEAAEVIDPATITSDTVMFGATVTIRYEDDSEKTFTIVGMDEVDIEKGRISWVSPLASALMKARRSDIVQFHSPKGTQEIEILSIQFLHVVA